MVLKIWLDLNGRDQNGTWELERKQAEPELRGKQAIL
jgi:hypothetical protein